MNNFTRKIISNLIIILSIISLYPVAASTHSLSDVDLSKPDSTNVSIPGHYRYNLPTSIGSSESKILLIKPKEEQKRKKKPINDSRPKVGLVLSGGGAKGIAHIGVIKVLEEAGIPIDYIAGTSMGAIVGGLYSIGWTSAELDSLVRKQDWIALFSDQVNRKNKRLSEKEISDTYLISIPVSLSKKFSIPSGVVAGQNILNLLNEMTIGYHDDNLQFDSLPIPFACVAFDMVKGEEVVFHKGNLPAAIRASMSIPGVFEPVLKDSMMLVDGGISNNFPVNVVRQMGANIVIGVDLAAGLQNAKELNSIMGLVKQITTIISRDKYEKNLAQVDLYLKPDMRQYSMTSFTPEAIDTLLVRGEVCARENWDKIIALQEKVYVAEEYMQKQERMLANDTDSIQIGPIQFAGLTKNEETFTRRALSISDNTKTTKGNLNNAISKLRGCGAFSYVTYTLDNTPPYALTISVDEKQDAMINIGFRFDSQEMAAILLNTTLSMRGIQGPKLGLTVRLNQSPYIKLNFSSSNILLGRFNIAYTLQQNKYGLYKGSTQINNIDCIQNKVDIFFSGANPVKFTPAIGVNYEHFNYKAFLFSSENESKTVVPEEFISYYIKGYLETLNDHYFPTQGISTSGKVALHTDNFYGYLNSTPFASVSYNFKTAISPTKRFTIIPEIYGRTLIGRNIAYSYFNHVGGHVAGRYVEHQIPFIGIKYIEKAYRSILTASIEARLRLFTRHFISAKVGYGIQNDDFFQMFVDRHDLLGAGVQYSYNSPIGPISLLVDISNADKNIGVYFSLGKTF